MLTMRSPCLAFIALVACRFDPAGVSDDTASNDAAPAIDADPCAAEEIAAAGAHTCARRGDGTVLCWGDNQRGQIGAEATQVCPSTALGCNPTPTLVADLPPIAELGLGDANTCGLAVDRRAFCWGDNAAGQFGGDAPPGVYGRAIEVPERHGSIDLAGGETYTCARDGGGVIACSGQNAHGELGIGNYVPSATPMEIPSVEASGLAGGFQSVCAIRSADGQVLCWGSNDLGQLDQSSVGQDVLSPVPVTGVTGATAIAVGFRHGCALVPGGYAMCWGDNGDGQLGNGAQGSPEGPSTVGIPAPIDALATGANHTCVLRDGLVMCAGEGFGVAPVTIDLPAEPIELTAGSFHACARLVDKTVWCWGANAYGQLGDGSIEAPVDHAAVKARLCD
jgi:alpha-tubulin suppressor-like RCC1 family protein